MAVEWKKLAYESEVITQALLTGKGDIVYASSIGVAAALTIGTDNHVLTVATDIPAWEAPAAAAAHTLDDHTAAVGAVDFGLQEATDLVVMTVANEAALPAADLAVGQLCWATSELTLHVCTVSV